MKTELVNFINDLPAEVHTYNLILDEGLYVFVDLDENGNITDFQKEAFAKNVEMNTFFTECLIRQINSTMLTANKRFIQSFEIGSPFGIGFKKDVLLETENAKTGKKKGYSDKVINDKIHAYFEVAVEFLNPEKPEQLLLFSKFRQFCQKQLLTFSKKLLAESNKVKAIFIFLSEAKNSDFEETYQKYLSERGVFNDPKATIVLNNSKYQVSDTLNGFGIKKMFLEHKTAPFNLNMLISTEDAIKIWKFFELLRKKVLPNPCPIFIDKKEINEKVIALVKEDERISHSQLIKSLFENYSKDLGNYYLLFFQFISQKGYRIIDLDFVPSFKYELHDMRIDEIFHLGNKQQRDIKNVFEFEDIVVSKIFDQVMVSKFDRTKSIRYFTDFNDRKNYDVKFIKEFIQKQGKSIDNIIIQVLKYRKAFYDYIYKSKRESIQDFMFQDIMVKGVLDDIRADEYKDRNHTKEYAIKEKINIWFSLYHYFDFHNSKPINDMINKTETLRKRITEIAKKEGNKPFIENEDEFAFASGQTIYWLLLQSESANRTHAMLEPFLQKTDVKLFKEAIARTFEMYKHKFTLYPTKYEFDRVISQVLGCESEINLKSLLPMILAGYFSDSAFQKY